MPLVSLSGVSVSFGDRKLLDSVNLTVAGGSRTALVGPNGSGKTTLMRIMAGLAVPDIGTVTAEKDTRVSYVPQSGDVHADCTLREEVAMAVARGNRRGGERSGLGLRLGALFGGSPEGGAALWKHHGL